jgi:hypothetical protein
MTHLVNVWCHTISMFHIKEMYIYRFKDTKVTHNQNHHESETFDLEHLSDLLVKK